MYCANLLPLIFAQARCAKIKGARILMGIRYIRGAVHTQVTTQNVNWTLWVGGCVWKGVLWRNAVTICIPFPDIESKLITSQNNHAQSIIPLPIFFNCVTTFTMLAHASKNLILRDVTCTLTCNVKNTTFSIFTTYFNHTQESDILKRWHELKKNWITSTLYIYLDLCKHSLNLMLHWNNTGKKDGFQCPFWC